MQPGSPAPEGRSLFEPRKALARAAAGVPSPAVSVPPTNTPILSSWPSPAGIAGPLHANARCFMISVWHTCRVRAEREPGSLAGAVRCVGSVVDTRMCRQDGDSLHRTNSSASQEGSRKGALYDWEAAATSAGHTMLVDPAADTAVASLGSVRQRQEALAAEPRQIEQQKDILRKAPLAPRDFDAGRCAHGFERHRGRSASILDNRTRSPLCQHDRVAGAPWN